MNWIDRPKVQLTVFIGDNRIESQGLSGTVVMEVVDEDTTENITNKYTGIS